MRNSATNAARHRKAVSFGLSASVVAHVAVLGLVQLPGVIEPDAEDPGIPSERVEPFDAIELVQLETSEVRIDASAQPAVSPSGSADADAAAPERSLESRLAELAPATLVTAARLDRSRPVVTFSDLDPISSDADLMAALYGDLFEGLQEEEQGGLGGLLDAIGAALSGGGHCPTPATSGGPLILR